MHSRSPRRPKLKMCPSSTLNIQHTRVLHIIGEIAKSTPLLIYSMAFKRKRSDSETSPSSSSTATFPSRDASWSPCPDISMLDDAAFSAQPIHRPEIVPSHLNSRTRKRFRDNRPDESKIHGTYLRRWIREPSALFSFSFADRPSVSDNISKAFLSRKIPSPH